MSSLVARYLGLFLLGLTPSVVVAQTAVGLSPAQVFEIATRAISAGDDQAAIAAYTALANDPDADIRREARFRHGQLLASRGRLADAALLFRGILDESPNNARVRVELAAVLARMGDMRAASRELRQAQAGGLPPDIARVINQFSAALRSTLPYGASLEVSLAPSSNINRATNDTTLDTIIAPFELSEDARAQSGVGIKIGGQTFAKLPVTPTLQFTARVSGQGQLYRQSQFDEALTNAQVGVETRHGRWRIAPQIGNSLRWYGGNLYAVTHSASLNLTTGLGRQALLELEGGIAKANYRKNALQDGYIYDASVRVERAFSARTGAALSLVGQRQAAHDPGYSTVMGGLGIVGWREAGRTTIFANAGVYRLEADKRIFLYPERRREWMIRAGGGATFRTIQVFGFSPVIRLNYERNRSTVGIYDYRRFTTEIGITRSF